MLLTNAEIHADNPEFQRDMLATVRASVGKISRLLSRLEAERQERSHALTLVGERLRRVTEECHLTRDANIVLELDDDGAGAAIHPKSFDAVVTHLLNNAIEASGDKPVAIHMRREALSLVIDIVDQGPGMTPEFIRDHLFQPFASTKSGGHGIGAFQARELLREAGGDLLVLNVPHGSTQGSTQGARRASSGAPRRVPSGPTWAAPRCGCCCPGWSPRCPNPCRCRPERVARMAKPKLLIVEDDEGLCSQYRWAFPACDVLLAHARPQAVALAKKEHPPVAIMDLGLPPDPDGVSEGFATLEEMQRIAPETKVIIVTGNGERKNALKAIASGAYDFCEKPVEIEVLRTIIERGLNLHRLESENRRLAAMPARSSIDRIITGHASMLKVCRDVEKLATTNVPVLLLGESGTGKEALAAALHELGPRAKAPLRGHQLRRHPGEPAGIGAIRP